MAKNPVGRPTKYTKDIGKKTDEYIEACEDEYKRWTSLKSLEKGYEKYSQRLKVNLPTVAGLALHLKISRETVYDWASKNQDFSDKVKDILSKQERVLMEKGLSGEYNPMIAKLLLSSTHGHRERSDMTSDDKPIGQLLDELDN